MMIDRSQLCTFHEVFRDRRFKRDEVLEIEEFWLEAAEFVRAHSWCIELIDQNLALSAAPVLCVFLVDIRPLPPADSSLWVISGDIPPAYIDARETHTAVEALEDYCAAMNEWIDAVQSTRAVTDLIPVRERGSLALVDESREVADALATRIAFIKEHIIPNAKSEKRTK